jgi:Leucine-rich repeat (LRR) protein
MMRSLRSLLSAVLGLLLAGSLLSACSSTTGPDGEDEDLGPPAPITDLRVTDFTATTVSLAWSATGDDGKDGRARRYEVRRHDVFIYPATWDAAVVVPGAPEPAPPGATETMTIGGLTPEQTYFFALTAFDDQDNSFGVSNCVSVTCFDNPPIEIPDPALRAALLERLGLETGPLHRADLRNVVDLGAIDAGVADLTGLQECIHLTTLHMPGSFIVDLSPLANLTGLTQLNLTANDVQDLTALQTLSALTLLWLNDNEAQDLSPLAGCIALESLQLERNGITSVAPLANMTALTELLLSGNDIESIQPLGGLVALRRLTLFDNPIGTLAPVAPFTDLEVLEASQTGVSDLAPLTNLTALRVLSLVNNRVSDPTPLAGLTSLEFLGLTGNQITSIEALSSLTKVKVLLIAANAIGDLSPLMPLAQLEQLGASYNQIADLAPLVANAGLGSGDTVDVQHNPLSVLAVQEQIPALTARGIDVLY